MLFSEWFNEEPDRALLREAEQILRSLIRQTDDNDFKFNCVKALAALYKEKWADEQGYSEVVNMLPSISSCREFYMTERCHGGAVKEKEEIEDCLLTLAWLTVSTLRDYVAYILPNGEETWDDKLS